MKKIIFATLFAFTIFFQLAQDKAKLYFMRSTGFNGSANAFTAFVDDSLVCKLNNKKFSINYLEPGEHSFSVQFAGKKSKEKRNV